MRTRKRPSQASSKKIRLGEFPCDVWFESVKHLINDLDADNLKEVKDKAITLKHEFDLASTYYRKYYEPLADNIDTDVIPEFINEKRNILAQKKLVSMGFKHKIQGLNPDDSDKLLLYWSRNINPQYRKLLSISPLIATYNFDPSQKPPSFHNNKPSASVQQKSALAESTNMHTVKTESVTSTNQKYPEGINFVELESNASSAVLVGRFSFLKASFDKTPNAKSLDKSNADDLVTVLMCVVAELICYRLHYKKQNPGKEPRWGVALWGNVSKVRSIWRRALYDKYKFLCFWVMIDIAAVKKELKSKDLAPLDFASDKDAPKVVKHFEAKAKEFFRKKKIKKDNEFYGLKAIFARCYKEKIKIHLK